MIQEYQESRFIIECSHLILVKCTIFYIPKGDLSFVLAGTAELRV